mmetsp:Transcript_55487/g.133832  ORF Transcript_55487/g.133832 Transcript_55487/m.133832 type:complete len:208 (-) Transcript_55487:1004-1627(-)
MVPALARRCSRLIQFSGGKPTHARITFVRASRCRKSAFTTGVPPGTNGALSMNDRSDSTECMRAPAGFSASLPDVFDSGPARAALMAASASAADASSSVMRSHSSATTTRSMMSGAASSESSHVLCIAIVFVPPMKIWDVYSSMARLESLTAGTYLITTVWSGCSPSAYSSLFEATMSSTTLLLEISFDRNCFGADRFLPSLLPRWL